MTEKLVKFKIHTVLTRFLDYRFSYFYNLGILSNSAWLAGGALRGIVDKTDNINDFDVFFKNKTSYDLAVSRLEKHKLFNLVFSCQNNKLKTYSGIVSDDDKNHYVKIQLITPQFYENIEEVLNSFNINAGRLIMDNKYVYTYRSVLRDIKYKEINLHNVTFPNATFKRMIKYQFKNYKITNQSIDFFVDKVYNMGATSQELQNQHYID
jgi:hypothetical protein